MRRIRVRIDEIAITPELRGNYVTDKQFKRQFQLWLNDVWLQKDQHLAQMKGATTQPLASSSATRAASAASSSSE